MTQRWGGRYGRYDFIAVYILASKRNGTLYTGVTSDLPVRMFMHRSGQIPGFTQEYGCKTLVWFERHALMREAIRREKQIKRWRRAWKLAMIEAENPVWRDLYWISPIHGPSTSTPSTQHRHPGQRIALIRDPGVRAKRWVPGLAQRARDDAGEDDPCER